MALKFTQEQQKVIDVRKCNVLVSAAAGSGKTAVLVERIIKLVTDEENPIDIDKILVVTFTNAAAAQMREKIYEAIVKRQEENPENAHLARQATLVHSAMITTIHSLCLFLLHNHFYEIDLDPAFRIADQGEISLLKEDILKNLIEECYQQKDEAFLLCKSYFAPGIKNRGLYEQIEELYKYAMSYPWPEKWLMECKNDFCITTKEALYDTKWMKFGLQYAKETIREHMESARQQIKLCEQSDGPYTYVENAEADLALLEGLANLENYEEFREKLSAVKFSTLSRKKSEGVDEAKKQKFKDVREEIKKDIAKLKESYFADTPEQILEGLFRSKEPVAKLIDLTLEFKRCYEEAKREKKMIDFNDMEHLALTVLLGKDKEEPTETALSYRDYFKEIMIDEYQDSNLVQELLLSTISREESSERNNRFMVGDIKQSIYKFRLARPEIFREKYLEYEQGTENDGFVRIDLNKNFRSRKEVIDSVNQICAPIMMDSIGGVSYDEKAALHQGAEYPNCEGKQSFETELLLYEEESQNATLDVDMVVSEEKNAGKDAGKNDVESLSAKEKEAAMIANRIKAMVGTFLVTDDETKELRPARYSDMVILLRANAGWDEVFRKELKKMGIPVLVETKTGYFSAEEIKTLMQYLKVLNNPYNDIALTSMLTSVFGGMEASDLAKLRLIKEDGYLYDNLLQMEHPKAKKIVNHILKYRELAQHTGIYELLCEIVKDSHYLEYVLALPDGAQRRANVEMLLEKAVAFEKTSYHGLYSFIQYMDKLKKYEIDFGEAEVSSDDTNMVRIMSIHKSKGLEFPICFMAGMSKGINYMDTKQMTLKDIDMGIAVPVIDCDKHIRLKSARREIMAKKINLDCLGEELRILYVGLTRAKEKLILSGYVKNYEEYIKKVECTRDEHGKVPFSRLIKAKSYLDLVMLATGNGGIRTELYHADDFLKDEVVESLEKQVLQQRLWDYIKDGNQRNAFVDESERAYTENVKNDLQGKFSFHYPYEYLSRLYTKTSVSELKKAHIHQDEETNVVFETERTEIPYLPDFMKTGDKCSGVNRGSAYHRVLELISYQDLYTLYEKADQNQYTALSKDTLVSFTIDQMEKMKNGEYIGEDINLVSVDKIAKFLGSNAAYRMAKADSSGKLYKEQPFVMAIDASRVVKEMEPDTEKVLIQGIIDVFFYETCEETGEEKIVVLDYKTDRVEHIGELAKRYQVQLDYYGEALNKLTNMSVAQKIIYSFRFDKEMIL